MKPIVLCIMDGCGIRDTVYGNAFAQAKKPNFDYLLRNFPNCKIEASGELVGLPKGQMGNSEVGHMNIGAGRIVYQPLELINKSIKDETFYQNKEIKKVMNHTKKNNSKLHIMGLISDGGVHSHIEHLMAILEMCRRNHIKDLYLHLFTDGRDVYPTSAYSYISKVEDKLKEIGFGKIATISGRYYAMDRDNNYDRLMKAYDVIVNNKGKVQKSVQDYITESYNKGVTDEFLLPARFVDCGNVEENDGIIVFNYRRDRLRELFTAITNRDFNALPVTKFSNVKVVTMLPVVESVKASSAFLNPSLKNILGEYLSNEGFSQLRIAETEKYAHVTFFFDGGVEVEYPNEKKILIPSPKVPTYDLKPEMSANEVADALLAEIGNFDVVILNFANGDMVGHTGDLNAAKKAVETVDKNIGRIYDKVCELDGIMIVTADHGNCEEMLDENGNILKTHTTNLVPLIITKAGLKLRDGKLADIAPTLLTLLGCKVPLEMTGKSLIVEQNQKKIALLQRIFLTLAILSIIIFVVAYFNIKGDVDTKIEPAITAENTFFTNLKGDIATNGNGLYVDEEGYYVYKGKNVANYIKYNGYLWRIVKIDPNGRMYLISENVVTMLNYGIDGNFDSSYVKKWMNSSEDSYSGILSKQIDTKNLIATRWCTGVNMCSKKNLFGLLSERDYQASFAEDSYLHIETPFWLLSNNSTMAYVNASGTVETADNKSILGVRPMVVIDGNLETFYGEGNIDNPYYFEENDGITVGDYISYSNMLWRIVSIDNSYQLVLNDTMRFDVTNTFMFSNLRNKFLPTEEGSIAYLLNHAFYDTLDKSHIVESTWYTGEYTMDSNLDYSNIYSDSVRAYVGLLHVGDMFIQDTITLTPSTVGSIYAYESNSIETIPITELNYVKPSIHIEKNFNIQSGDGSIESPYYIVWEA